MRRRIEEETGFFRQYANSREELLLDWDRSSEDAAGDGTAILVDGRHHWVDSAYCGLFARPMDALLGERLDVLFDAVHSDPPAATATILMSADTDTHHEFRACRQDGEPLFVRFAARRVVFEGRGAVRIVVRDLTAQKQAEDALRESERRFRQLADLLPELVYECDNDLRITYANRAAFETLGYPEDALEAGVYVTDFLSPEQARLAFRRLGHAAATGALTRGVYDLLTLDGRQLTCEIRSAPIWDADGATVGYRGVIHDMTHQRRHEEAMLARQERLKAESTALVDLSRTATVAEGSLEDAFRQITETSARTMGVARVSVWLYSPDRTRLDCADLYELEPGRHSAGGALSQETSPRYFQALSEARTIAAVDALTDPRTREFARDYLEPHGIVSMLDAPVRVGGELVGVVCHEHTGQPREWQSDEQSFAASVGDLVALCMEAAERASAQEQLSHHARELERSNAELERFATVASHDLKAPLNTVATFVQLVGKRHEEDEVSREYVHHVIQAVERMVSLMDDLLSYARVGSKPTVPEVTDMNEILDGVVLQLRRRIEEAGATVEHDDLPDCRVDPGQMHQLFQNLLGNSLKFHSERTPHVWVRAALMDRQCHLTISDNGIGIPEDQWERIFRVFERGAHTVDYPGTGVGLSICQRIVQNHGGRIWVESVPGDGATFHILLPAAG